MERRTSHRVQVDLAVEERTDGARYFQRAADLSESGVWLASTLPHPPGTPVELELALPGAPMRVRGEVAGSDRHLGMAVRFVALGDDQRERIGDYLRVR